MVLTGLLCGALVVFTGCVPISKTYSVRRSALVPAPNPPMRAGRPIDGRVDLAAHVGTSLLDIDAASNEQSATYVARTTVGTAARFRIGHSFDMGPVFLAGLGGRDAERDPGVPEPPAGGPLGVGLSMQLAPRFDDERFGLAGVFDFVLWSIPVREEWWCLDCGGAPSLDMTENTHEGVPVFGLALMPSFRPDSSVTLFGGMTLRNQPQVRASEVVVTTSVGEGDSEDELEMGPVNVVASLGAELDLGAGAHALLVASQPIGASEVSLGPSVSASLGWSLGEPAPR